MVDPNATLEKIAQVHFLHIFLNFEWINHQYKIIIHQFQAIFFHLALTQLKDNYVVLVCTNTI
jgi:hypothetical protein